GLRPRRTAAAAARPRSREPDYASQGLRAPSLDLASTIGPVDAARIADFLAESPLFACLSPTDRLALAGKMRARHVASDEAVFHRDDEAVNVCLVRAG